MNPLKAFKTALGQLSRAHFLVKVGAGAAGATRTAVLAGIPIVLFCGTPLLLDTRDVQGGSRQPWRLRSQHGPRVFITKGVAESGAATWTVAVSADGE